MSHRVVKGVPGCAWIMLCLCFKLDIYLLSHHDIYIGGDARALHDTLLFDVIVYVMSARD